MKKRIINYWERIVKNWYQKIRSKEEFILDAKVLKVKKGSVKYRLLFLETTQGKYKFNLGRHKVELNELSPIFNKECSELEVVV